MLRGLTRRGHEAVTVRKMNDGDSNFDGLSGCPSGASSSPDAGIRAAAPQEDGGTSSGSLDVTCFTENVDDVSIHFQIIRLPKQIYAWIGYKNARLGHLHAAARTRPDNSVGVTSVLSGEADDSGSSIAKRLVLKTGLSIFLACNLPKNNPILEAMAEKLLMQKLVQLKYTRQTAE